MGKSKTKGSKHASAQDISSSGRKGGKAGHAAPKPSVDLIGEPVTAVSLWPPLVQNQDDEAQQYLKEPEIKYWKLSLQRVALLKDAVYMVPGVLTPEECAAWVAFAEARGFVEARHAASAGIALRDNGRIAIHSPEIAQTLFQRIKGVCPPYVDGRRLVGLSANVRLYRYMPGQRFNKHFDESCEENGAFSELTLLLYLSEEGLEGGETRFFAGNTGNRELLVVPPKLGAALMHHHGERCLMHEGALVRSGVKFLMRTDLLYIRE